MKNIFPASLFLATLSMAVILATSIPAQGDSYVERVRKPIRQSINIRQETQQSRERWEKDRQELTARLQNLQSESRQLTTKQNALQTQIRANRQKVDLYKQQIINSTLLSREIRPYLDLVYLKLTEQISRDRPFLENERQHRLRKLRLLLDDPDVTVSEKYRRTMETLFIEAEYGSSVEVYRKTIIYRKQELTANIFRLGRVSVFFQSPDKNRTGFYDHSDRTWKAFPASYNREINAAFEIAAKRRPIKMVNLPLGRLAIP